MAKFNPVGLSTDIEGAHLAGIANAVGENGTKIKSCEFHFKEHRTRMLRKLDSESSDIFRTLRITSFNGGVKATMGTFISKKKETTYLKSYISWWHDRGGLIFRAFVPREAPQMKQAEVVHARWVHRDIPNMSLLDVCFVKLSHNCAPFRKIPIL